MQHRIDLRLRTGPVAWSWLLLLALCFAGAGSAQAQGAPVAVGSKAFAESWILGEALTQLARSVGADAKHARNLGGTDIVYAALKSGSVDVYPEYTGTIAEAILKLPGRPSLAEMRARLAPEGIGIGDSLGFNNGYALAVNPETARRLRLEKISDLARHPELRVALTHEFLERKDGWPSLSRRYGLRMAEVRGIQHDLAYRALQNGQIDVMDVYTTDAQIAEVKPRLLVDDREFFPRYEAVLLYRLDLPARNLPAWAAMQRLVGQVDETEMIAANAQVVLEKHPEERAAAALLREAADLTVPPAPTVSGVGAMLAHTLRHLQLVGISLAAAALVGIPLGIAAARSRFLSALILSTAGLLQTIPSLALLAFLIALLGRIGVGPALVALFLYSLLPIVRNTYVGLTTIPPNLSEAAEALGLAPATRLLRIDLPMASPAIMAGLKTSAVINVGTATLAAFIGAGGLGEPILRGLQTLNDQLILQGAVPAALLALAVQGAFDLLDRVIVPRGLRFRSNGE